MEYCVVEDGIITNIIVCENDNIAAEFGAHSIYDGAVIGEKYRPPESAPEPEPEYVTYEELAAAIREGVNAV